MNILKFKNAFTHDTRIQSCTYTHTQALSNVCMVVSCLDFSCAVSMFSRDRTARPQGQYHRFNGTHTWSIGTWNGTFNILFHFTTPHTCNRTLLFLKIKLIEEKNILKKLQQEKKEKNILFSYVERKIENVLQFFAAVRNHHG